MYFYLLTNLFYNSVSEAMPLDHLKTEVDYTQEGSLSLSATQRAYPLHHPSRFYFDVHYHSKMNKHLNVNYIASIFYLCVCVCFICYLEKCG